MGAGFGEAADGAVATGGGANAGDVFGAGVDKTGATVTETGGFDAGGGPSTVGAGSDVATGAGWLIRVDGGVRWARRVGVGEAFGITVSTPPTRAGSVATAMMADRGVRSGLGVETVAVGLRTGVAATGVAGGVEMLPGPGSGATTGNDTSSGGGGDCSLETDVHSKDVNENICIGSTNREVAGVGLAVGRVGANRLAAAALRSRVLAIAVAMATARPGPSGDVVATGVAGPAGPPGRAAPIAGRGAVTAMVGCNVDRGKRTGRSGDRLTPSERASASGTSRSPAPPQPNEAAIMLPTAPARTVPTTDATYTDGDPRSIVHLYRLASTTRPEPTFRAGPAQ
jgi:hypothetical protein